MGIRKTVKKLVLPLIGRTPKPEPGSTAPRPRPVARPVFEEPESPRGDVAPLEWIDAQVKGNKLVLFMKGNPDQPQCGFSANAAGILRQTGTPIHHVDVLLDGDVREAVKQYSQWPTIPQLFINGEFMGGSDILTEMSQNGELSAELAKPFEAAAAENAEQTP